jgi:hypothetical protein
MHLMPYSVENWGFAEDNSNDTKHLQSWFSGIIKKNPAKSRGRFDKSEVRVSTTMGQYLKFAFYFPSFGDGPIREAHCPFFFKNQINLGQMQSTF